MFPQGVDPVKQCDYTVQGVNALLRRICGMGCLALELKLIGVQGIAGGHKEVLRGRMEHHGCVHISKEAGVCQDYLAASRLFRRCAQDCEFSAELSDKRGQAQGCPNTGCPDQVVAAGMAELRQGIILTEQGYVGATLAQHPAKGCFQPGYALGDLKTSLFEGTA